MGEEKGGRKGTHEVAKVQLHGYTWAGGSVGKVVPAQARGPEFYTKHSP